MAPFQKRPRPSFSGRSRSSRAPKISSHPRNASASIAPKPSLPGRSRHAERPLSRLGAERRCLLRVCCEPGSDILHELETFASAYLKQRFRPSLAQSVATASYELCSNAINYSSVATDVTFEVWSSTTAIEVCVHNEAVLARLEVLRQVTERILANPEDAYLQEMRRSIAGKMPRAMLGLARVVHEAGMDLKLQVDGRSVRVTARCPR